MGDLLEKLISSCTGTKFTSGLSDLPMIKLALDTIKTIYIEDNGRKELDIKRYAKVEKIPGGQLDECRVLKGVMMNKDAQLSNIAAGKAGWAELCCMLNADPTVR